MKNPDSLLGRMMFSVLGVFVYVYSLTQPAINTKVWEVQETLNGTQCLFFGAIQGGICLLGLKPLGAILGLLSNVLMGISVLFTLSCKKAPRLSLLMFGVAIIIFLASLFPNHLLPNHFLLDDKTVFLTGYYFWASSFVLMATGLFFEVRFDAEEKETAPAV